MATKTEYCRCGAAIKIMGVSRTGVTKAIALWREGHVGDGHGPATLAYMARIKNEKPRLSGAQLYQVARIQPPTRRR